MFVNYFNEIIDEIKYALNKFRHRVSLYIYLGYRHLG